MKIQQYDLACLSHASQTITDEKTKPAAVVDPQPSSRRACSSRKAISARRASGLVAFSPGRMPGGNGARWCSAPIA